MTRYEIIEARKTARLRDMHYSERKEAVRGVVFRLYGLKGEDPRGHLDLVDRCAAELEERCAKAFPTCTLGEVKLAMDAGIRGEWGKNTNIYPANLLSWLQSYATSPERREAVKEQEAAEAVERERSEMYPSAEETARRNDEFRKNGPERAYRNYLRNGWDVLSSGYGESLYQAMVASGEIVLPLPDDIAEEAGKAAAGKIARQKGARTFLALSEEQRHDEWHVHTEVVRIVFERKAMKEEDLPW